MMRAVGIALLFSVVPFLSAQDATTTPPNAQSQPGTVSSDVGVVPVGPGVVYCVGDTGPEKGITPPKATLPRTVANRRSADRTYRTTREQRELGKSWIHPSAGSEPI